MKYRDHTFNDPNPIKAYCHKQRLRIALRLLGLADNESLLDFGAGDGTFAELVAAEGSKVNIFVYEPTIGLFNQIKYGRKTMNINDFSPGQFEKIVCLEVLEHLPEKDLKRVLNSLSELMAANGKLLVSVPIETSLSGLIKNVYRYFHSKNIDKIDLGILIKSFFGLCIKKRPLVRLDGLDYIPGHVGFSYLALKRELEKHFVIKRQCCSPFPSLGTAINHCVYYLCSGK
jgi:hypothetical protein